MLKERCNYGTSLSEQKPGRRAINLISEWHQKVTFDFTEIVNDRKLRQETVTAWQESVRIRSYSGSHFRTFGLIRNRITPNTDTFYAGSILTCDIRFPLFSGIWYTNFKIFRTIRWHAVCLAITTKNRMPNLLAKIFG